MGGHMRICAPRPGPTLTPPFGEYATVTMSSHAATFFASFAFHAFMRMVVSSATFWGFSMESSVSGTDVPSGVSDSMHLLRSSDFRDSTLRLVWASRFLSDSKAAT